MSTVYTVFRRNDGYVNSIASDSAEAGLARLRPYGTMSGTVSFTILLQTTKWTSALAMIEQEQDVKAS